MRTFEVSSVCPPVILDLRNPWGGLSNMSIGYQKRTKTPSVRKYVSTCTSSFCCLKKR